MDVSQFQEILSPMTEAVAGKPVDDNLRQDLDRLFPAGAEAFKSVESACLAAIEAG
jgi:hypothetical protein